jgi:hypothetical protein
MHVQVSLTIEIAATAGLPEMEQQIQEATAFVWLHFSLWCDQAQEHIRFRPKWYRHGMDCCVNHIVYRYKYILLAEV